MIRWLINLLKKYDIKIKAVIKTPNDKKVKGVKIEGKF